MGLINRLPLRLLSKHVMANREIEAKELENQKLKEMLELKESLAGKAPDWELAKQLRSEGEKIIRIAQVLGVGRSTVYNHLAKG
jgi:transcriptional regulator of acetoin/glycerol metabolism